MSNLTALADRCETSTFGSNKLDCQIDVLFGGLSQPGVTGRWNTTPRYTSSLNAALMLVPSGWSWRVTWQDGLKESSVQIFGGNDEHRGRSARPALAVCAAALRALAAKGGRE